MGLSPPMNGNTSRGTRPTQSNESAAYRGRDAGNGAHNDGNDAEANNPPTGHLNRGPGLFISQVDPDTLPEEGWIDELQERARRFREAEETEQADLSGWSE